MDFELKSVQHASQIQDHKIQSLNETLKSKESEVCNIAGFLSHQSPNWRPMHARKALSVLMELTNPKGGLFIVPLIALNLHTSQLCLPIGCKACWDQEQKQLACMKIEEQWSAMKRMKMKR